MFNHIIVRNKCKLLKFTCNTLLTSRSLHLYLVGWRVKLTTQFHLIPTEFKNVWNYTATSPYAFVAWCLINLGAVVSFYTGRFRSINTYIEISVRPIGIWILNKHLKWQQYSVWRKGERLPPVWRCTNLWLRGVIKERVMVQSRGTWIISGKESQMALAHFHLWCSSRSGSNFG
jgi:hypothetical protein